MCCAWRKIWFSTKHSKSLSVHRFSYLLIYFTLCASPCVCTGLVTHSVAHILFSSELPLSLCKGSPVNPNLLNNKVEQIVSKLEQVLLSDSYLTWFHPSSKSLPSHILLSPTFCTSFYWVQSEWYYVKSMNLAFFSLREYSNGRKAKRYCFFWRNFACTEKLVESSAWVQWPVRTSKKQKIRIFTVL